MVVQNPEMVEDMLENTLDNATDSSTTRTDAKDVSDGNKPKQPKYKTNNQSPNASFTQQKPKTKDQFVNDKRREASQKIQNQRKQFAEQKAYQARQTARDEQIKALGKRGGSVTGLGMLGAVADGFFTYQSEREKDPNGSKVVDGLKAGLTAGAWIVAEPVMWGITLGGLATAGTKMLYEDAKENYDIKKSAALHVNKDESGANKGTLGSGTFIDNEYAATSRQRQEQIMRNHRISTESILGSEARQLHR